MLLLFLSISLLLTAAAGITQERGLASTDYQALVEADTADKVAASLGPWLIARRRTNEFLDPKGAEMSKHFSGPDLNKLTNLRAEHDPIDTADPKDFALILLSMDRAGTGRRNFVGAMELLDFLEVRLNQSLSKQGDPRSLDALFIWARARSALASDYAAKLERVAKRLSLQCAVTVRTIDPFTGTELKNYEVLSVPVFWHQDESKEEPFPQVSSPTTNRLDAGNYVVWCRRKVKTGYLNGERKLLRVANDVAVDVIVPVEVK